MDTNEVMRLTLGKQFKAMGFHITGTILMIIYIIIYDPNEITKNVFLVCWVTYFLPAAYLQFQYTKENWGQVIEIEDTGLKIIDQKSERRYNTEELKKITLWKSASLDKGGIQFLPMEGYHYAKIETLDGKNIFITSLLTTDVETAVRRLNGVPYQRKKSTFCAI